MDPAPAVESTIKMEYGSITIGSDSVKLFKYRWIILTIFCLYSAINFMQFLQYSIISNIIVKYYNADSFLVDLTGLIFMISYIVFFIPVGHLIERYNLKVTAILGSGLTAIGNLLKFAAVARDRIAVVLVSQLLCAIAQVFVLTVPTKLASTWFGPDEVSTACAIAVLGTQLGIAIGCITSPNVIRNSNNIDAIGADINTMTIYNAVVTCVIFVLVVIFFRARPPLPPSQSQLSIVESKTESQSTFRLLKELMSNKNFLLLTGTFGVANGIWTSFGIYFNSLYLEYFPGSEVAVGWLSFAAVISGGCIGSVIFGYLLDKTHKFRLIAFVTIFGSAVLLILQLIVMEEKVKVATYVIIPIFGFFMASTLVVSFEYATEITYPLPEALSCGVLNAVIFACSIIVTLVVEALFSAIGYLWTIVIIIVLLFLSSFGVCFVVPDLRRREENIKGTSKMDNSESTDVKAASVTRL